jgi:hypothetical protein
VRDERSPIWQDVIVWRAGPTAMSIKPLGIKGYYIRTVSGEVNGTGKNCLEIPNKSGILPR